MTRAASSAPTPDCGQPSSTVTMWLVFLTLLIMAGTSRGRMVRRLITCGNKQSGTAGDKQMNKVKSASMPDASSPQP
jgi:hypothetical protein